MHRRHVRCATVGVTAAVVAALVAVPTGAQASTPKVAAPQALAQATAPAPPAGDVREIPSSKKYQVKDFTTRGTALRAAPRALAAPTTPSVGTKRQWIALDDLEGSLYRKNYTLRGVGNKIEVWVADDIAFPAGDCRMSTPGSTEVTDAQVQGLITEFDTNMFPKESAAFSVAPDRDGTNALLGPDKTGNGGNYTGSGDKIVTLVDNVRDDNYYTFPAAPTYIAGFFSSQFNDLLDRNVMTIDAFDWLHRTGANPVDAPTDDLCTSRPARERLYEGVFAHEYQHLLQSYQDPAEVNWVNEGLSDYAETLTGYANSNATVFQKGAQSHLFCFQGFGTIKTPYNTNPRACGGPANSLTLWGDQGDGNEILADYGNAWSMMLFLSDRYGLPFMSALHRDGEHQGIASLQHELDNFAPGTKAYSVIHDFQTMVLLDQTLGGRFGLLLGKDRRKVTTPSLTSSVNLDNPASYAAPGAAPNGADYVALRNGSGRVLRGSELRSLSFSGATELPTQPLVWSVVSNDPDRAGNPVLFSGNTNNTDASAVLEATVPTSDPTLSFLAKYGAEEGYDYGYVLVSTDGGATYTPIAGSDTVAGPLGPALNGTTVGFEKRTYNLSAYAGQKVLIGFRYVSDGGVNEGGLLLDDITLGSTVLSDGSSLAPFRSFTEVRPTKVANWNVRLVGYDERLRVAAYLEVDGKNAFSLSRGQLIRFLTFPKVVAIVGYDDPTEQVQQSAGYTLTVNGVTQPGGR